MTDREHRAPLRSLNVAPRAPAYWSGPFGARSGRVAVPTRSGATGRRPAAGPTGADRTTRDAGRRPTDPTWTARGVVAQWATPRDVPTTPIQNPIPRQHAHGR